MRSKSCVMLAALTMAAACGGSSSNNSSINPPGTQVTISDFMFSPSNLSVKAGTTVTWVNQGPMTHTTVSDSGVWSSANLAPPSGGGGYGGGSAGGSFQFTFDTPGSYPYHCSLHPPASYPGFVGTITVTP
jgi:plastocyanin